MIVARFSIAGVALLLFSVPSIAQVNAQKPAKPHQPQDDEISGLIAKLRSISETGTGYSSTTVGSGFLPLDVSQTDALLFSEKRQADSNTIREIVKFGVTAVPFLILNLNDKRTTRVTARRGGEFGGIFFSDEYDYNGRTSEKPLDVNYKYEINERKASYSVTVGDLCFVALGQIVNREFLAVRYQPTLNVFVNSPTRSGLLQKAIKKEWGELTPDGHRKSLAADMLEADSEARRIGAFLRLGYYYPECVQPLVLKQLATPLYDVCEVEHLIRDELYRTKDVRKRKIMVDAFLTNRGEVARQGTLLHLFQDLIIQEAGEAGRTSPPWRGQYDARACLIDVFGYPKNVQSKDRPIVYPVGFAEHARFIEALVHFPSTQIDTAVRKIMYSANVHEYLVEACAGYLVSRGATSEIRRYVKERWTRASEPQRLHLQRLLDQCVSPPKAPLGGS